MEVRITSEIHRRLVRRGRVSLTAQTNRESLPKIFVREMTSTDAASNDKKKQQRPSASGARKRLRSAPKPGDKGVFSPLRGRLILPHQIADVGPLDTTDHFGENLTCMVR